MTASGFSLGSPLRNMYLTGHAAKWIAGDQDDKRPQHKYGKSLKRIQLVWTVQETDISKYEAAYRVS